MVPPTCSSACSGPPGALCLLKGSWRGVPQASHARAPPQQAAPFIGHAREAFQSWKGQKSQVYKVGRGSLNHRGNPSRLRGADCLPRPASRTSLHLLLEGVGRISDLQEHRKRPQVAGGGLLWSLQFICSETQVWSPWPQSGGSCSVCRSWGGIHEGGRAPVFRWRVGLPSGRAEGNETPCLGNNVNNSLIFPEYLLHPHFLI